MARSRSRAQPPAARTRCSWVGAGSTCARRARKSACSRAQRNPHDATSLVNHLFSQMRNGVSQVPFIGSCQLVLALGTAFDTLIATPTARNLNKYNHVNLLATI